MKDKEREREIKFCTHNAIERHLVLPSSCVVSDSLLGAMISPAPPKRIVSSAGSTSLLSWYYSPAAVVVVLWYQQGPYI